MPWDVVDPMCQCLALSRVQSCPGLPAHVSCLHNNPLVHLLQGLICLFVHLSADFKRRFGWPLGASRRRVGRGAGDMAKKSPSEYCSYIIGGTSKERSKVPEITSQAQKLKSLDNSFPFCLISSMRPLRFPFTLQMAKAEVVCGDVSGMNTRYCDGY
jgi:hypothetical protein